MKAFLILIWIIVVIAFAGTTFGEVEIRDKPLTWQQAALTDGEELYVELCAVCHGSGGVGDGPAASALKTAVPDLTALAAQNDGTFPRKEVEDYITGKSRVVSHGTVDMPIWGDVFETARLDWKPFRQSALARQRIYNLTEYLSEIQAE